jgi:hypothetical protein
MAKATESASLSVEPQRTKTRSWLRVPQPCLIAWLRNCRRRIRLKRGYRPSSRPLPIAAAKETQAGAPDKPARPRFPAPSARTVPTVDLLVANEGREAVPCQDRSRRRRWPKASLYKGLSPGHARSPRAPFECIAYVSYCKTTIRQVASSRYSTTARFGQFNCR